MSTVTLKEYFARAGSRFSNDDAKIIGPELERLLPAKAEDIVDAARSEKSPLHKYFEWNDSIAAEEYRKDQARSMIRSIVVKPGDGEYSRAFPPAVRIVSSVDDSGFDVNESKTYVTWDMIRNRPELADQIIREARQQLQGWKERYEFYRRQYPSFNDKFTPVFSAIEKLIESKPE